MKHIVLDDLLIPGRSSMVTQRFKKGIMNLARMFIDSGSNPSGKVSLSQLTRRKLLVGGSVLAGAALTGSLSAAQAHPEDILTLDVACDGRTFRLTRMDPTATDQVPTRGDTFIVNGKIYPGGTVETGLSGPDQPGSIGTWICRGWFYVEDFTDPEQVPHVITTQLYLLDDGNGLVSNGEEGGIKTRRAIIGGMGRWADIKGDVTQEDAGENDTLLDFGFAELPAPNIRFVFSMTSRG